MATSTASRTWVSDWLSSRTTTSSRRSWSGAKWWEIKIRRNQRFPQPLVICYSTVKDLLPHLHTQLKLFILKIIYTLASFLFTMLNSFYVLSHFEKLQLKSRLSNYFILASCYIRITVEDTKLGQCRSKLTLHFWPQLKLASPPHTTFSTWTSAEHSPRFPLYLNLTNNLNFSVLKIVFIESLSNCFIFYFFSGEEKELNPFMRVSQPAVRHFVGDLDNDIDTMTAVRAAKDKFKM